MVRKLVFNIVVMLGAFGLVNAVQAETMKGVCTISASAISGKKFVTLKCSKASQPGDYKIRSTVWEKDNHAEYAKMARFSGRRFACDLTGAGATRDGGMEITHYKLSKCH